MKVPINSAPDLDDVFAGRIITFLDGEVENRSFRVIRSLSLGGNAHEVIIELPPDLTATSINIGDTIGVNGVPRNSPGIGYDGTNIGEIANKDVFDGTAVGYDLPVALQPNHLTPNVDKSKLLGDFDESYDAADYNNWFLSYRHDNGTVIPSFHRPSVINYILNEDPNWEARNGVSEFSNVMASIARATMRPIPIFADQFSNTDPINERFTGGNSNFALRAPIEVNDATRLDQIVRVLTGSVANSYDVDNDGDGNNDSVWIDLDLPVFTSPEGKLIRPLVAPMIEDLSGRLNVNAHVNYGLVNSNAGLTGNGNNWTGAPITPFLFRGLGFGPAEINIPAPSANDLSRLLVSRYQGRIATDNVPGAPLSDPLSVLTNGWRPRTLRADAGYSRSIDPFGRGAVGISYSGNLASVNSGTLVTDNNDDH